MMERGLVVLILLLVASMTMVRSFVPGSTLSTQQLVVNKEAARATSHATVSMGRLGREKKSEKIATATAREGPEQEVFLSSGKNYRLFSIMEETGLTRAEWEQMEVDGSIPRGKETPLNYELAIACCANRGLCDKALQLCDDMEKRGLSPDKVYRTAVKACVNAGQYDTAYDCVKRMREKGMLNDVHNFVTAIDVSAQVGEHEHVLQLYEEMKRKNIRTITPQEYYHVLDAYRKLGRGDNKKVLDIFNEMRSAGYTPRAIDYSSALDVCAKEAYNELALSLLKDMRKDDHAPSALEYLAAIEACGKAGDHANAISLLQDMKDEHLLKSELSYYITAIDTYAEAGKYEEILDLLDDMKQKGHEPGAMTLSVAIDACGRAGRHDKALELLHLMKERGYTPDLRCYSTVIQSCGEAADYETALRLLNELRAEEMAGNVPGTDPPPKHL